MEFNNPPFNIYNTNAIHKIITNPPTEIERVEEPVNENAFSLFKEQMYRESYFLSEKYQSILNLSSYISSNPILNSLGKYIIRAGIYTQQSIEKSIQNSMPDVILALFIWDGLFLLMAVIKELLIEHHKP